MQFKKKQLPKKFNRFLICLHYLNFQAYLNVNNRCCQILCFILHVRENSYTCIFQFQITVLFVLFWFFCLCFCFFFFFALFNKRVTNIFYLSLLLVYFDWLIHNYYLLKYYLKLRDINTMFEKNAGICNDALCQKYKQSCLIVWSCFE